MPLSAPFFARRCWLAALLVLAVGCQRRSPESAMNRSAEVLVTMPGQSFQGPLPPLDGDQERVREQLQKHVKMLAGTIGERNLQRWPKKLNQAADYIETELAAAGRPVTRQSYTVDGQTCHNLISELPGTSRAKEILLVGAHYDSVAACPGANDNGSGVAALLTLAKELNGYQGPRTIRLVAFANEEAPYFGTQAMGAWQHAAQSRRRGDQIIGMISLETIGYFSDAAGSQHYPPPFNQYYPSTGNFIGFVGNPASAALIKQTVAAFRRHAKFPSEGGALPDEVPGVGWSDHFAFWRHNYPALMVTDTAPFRYPHYHKPSDTPDKLNYDRMSRVVHGLIPVLHELAGEPNAQ